MKLEGDFLTQIIKLMGIIIAVIVAIWLAFTVIRIVGMIIGLLLPVLFIGAVIWFVYKIMLSSDPNQKVG